MFERMYSNMKWPWFNTDFVDDTTYILPQYFPKCNHEFHEFHDIYSQMRVEIDPMYKASVIHQTNLDIKNEYLTGKKENKDMNHKIKNAKNDRVKNMLDKWTSGGCISYMIPKMIKHNGPATIVFWIDGTKTVVKANPDLIEEKRVCYLDESGKRHYKTVTIDRTDDSAAVMYAFVKRWVCNNEDTKFHHFLKVVESREEK